MNIDLAKLGELQKLATEIDSSKDGNKSGKLDTEKEISVFGNRIKSYNFSEAEMNYVNTIFGLEKSNATVSVEAEQKVNNVTNPIKPENLSKSDKKRMDAYVLRLLNQNITKNPADLVTEIQKTLGVSANNEYYKDLVGQIKFILDAVNKQGYNSKDDVDDLYDSVKKDLGISRKDDFAKDVLKALVLNAESAQKNREYNEIRTTYNKYIGEGKSIEEAFKATKDELKDKGSYFPKLLSKFEKEDVMGDARITVYKASDEADSTTYKKVKKETKENLKATGDYNKYTKKALKGELSFGEKLSFETSDMKNVLKAQAIDNNVEAKLLQSKEEILDTIGKDNTLFEALVAKRLIVEQPDGKYNLIKLSTIIRNYVGSDGVLNRQLSDFKPIAETTKTTSALSKEMGLNDLSADDAKKLVKLCGYEVEKKNWGKTIAGTAIDAVAGGIGGAVAARTNPRTVINRNINNDTHVEVNINCDSSLAEQIKDDFAGNASITTNIISNGIQIVIDNKNTRPLFYISSRHIVKTAIKTALITGAIDLLTSLNKEKGELPITATKIECSTLEDYKSILQNEVNQGAISQKYADALIMIAQTFEKDGAWDCKGYEDFISGKAAGSGSVLNRAELIIALKDKLVELDNSSNEPDEVTPQAPVDKPADVTNPTIDCPEENCEALLQDNTFTYTRQGGDTWTEIVRAFYPCLEKDYGMGGKDGAIRRLKKALSYNEDGSFNQETYKALLLGGDLPKTMKLPAQIDGCDRVDNAKVKKVAVSGNGKAKIQSVGFGYWTASDGCDGQMAKGKTKEEALANLKQKTGKTYTNEEELLK